MSGPTAMLPPALVPTLDEIVREPARAAALAAETVRALFGQAAIAQATLLPRLLLNDSGPAIPEKPEDWISLEEAAALVGRPRSWLLRRHPRPAWLKRLGRKTFVVNRRGLERWLDSRPS
jgi:hypothetical protein